MRCNHTSAARNWSTAAFALLQNVHLNTMRPTTALRKVCHAAAQLPASHPSQSMRLLNVKITQQSCTRRVDANECTQAADCPDYNRMIAVPAPQQPQQE